MLKKYFSLTLTAILFTACGGDSSPSKTLGEGAIDLYEYFPNTSMSKTFIETNRDGDNITKTDYEQVINVTDNTITTTTTEMVEKVVFTDKNITTTTTENNETEINNTFRHVDLEDTIFTDNFEYNTTNDLGQITTKLNLICKVASKEERFEKNDNLYTGDLLKIECITDGEVIYDVKQAILDAGAATDLNGSHAYYDTSYIYLKKDIGEVAYIDDNCIFDSTLPMIVDDRKDSATCIKQQYNYDFYLP